MSFTPGDHSRVSPFERAVADLGSHLGFVTQQPEVEFKKGPDGLWDLGHHLYAAIEAKSAAETEFISKSDVDQLAGSINWFRSEYPAAASVKPLMFHPSKRVHQLASPDANPRIVDQEHLAKLKTAFRTWSGAVAAQMPHLDSDLIGKQIAHYGFDSRALIQRYTAKVQR